MNLPVSGYFRSDAHKTKGHSQCLVGVRDLLTIRHWEFPFVWFGLACGGGAALVFRGTFEGRRMKKMTMREALSRPGFLVLAAGFICCLVARDMPQFLAIEDLNSTPATQYLLAGGRALVFLILLAVLTNVSVVGRLRCGRRAAFLPVTLAAPLALAGLALISFGHALELRTVGCALLGLGQSLFVVSWVLRLFEQPKRVMFYLLMVSLAGAGCIEMLLAITQDMAEKAVTLALPVLSWAAQMWWLRRGLRAGVCPLAVEVGVVGGAAGGDVAVGGARLAGEDASSVRPAACNVAATGVSPDGVPASDAAAAPIEWRPQGPGSERPFSATKFTVGMIATFFCYSFVIRQLTDTWMVHGTSENLMLFQLFGGLGTALTSLLVYYLFHLRKSRKQPATYTAFALPLLVAALYLSTFLTGTLSIVYVVPLFVMRKVLFVLAIIGALGFRQGADRMRFFSWAFLIVEGASIVQTVFYEWVFKLPDHGDILCNGIVFALVAFVAVREILAFTNGSNDSPEAFTSYASEPEAGGEGGAGSFGVGSAGDDVAPDETTESLRRVAVEQLRGEFGLTRREAEVAELLATGRNAEYIAKELFVAQSTAKTHISHIYQKTGLNSQQRLMDLVEERMGK
jgi:DNA-binding CsgD family transcriptional regulator